MDASDQDLARAAAGGDGNAFEALLTRHYDRIFRIGFRVLGNRAEAEDLAQDVAIGLATKIAGFQGRAKFTTWLTSVVVNAARDRLRRLATRGKAGAGWGEVEAMRRAEAVEARDALDWLQAAMARLDDELRETAALVVGEEMSHREAAEALGVAEGTVSWRMGEIRKRLRRMAQEEVA